MNEYKDGRGDYYLAEGKREECIAAIEAIDHPCHDACIGNLHADCQCAAWIRQEAISAIKASGGAAPDWDKLRRDGVAVPFDEEDLFPDPCLYCGVDDDETPYEDTEEHRNTSQHQWTVFNS